MSIDLVGKMMDDCELLEQGFDQNDFSDILEDVLKLTSAEIVDEPDRGITPEEFLELLIRTTMHKCHQTKFRAKHQLSLSESFGQLIQHSILSRAYRPAMDDFAKHVSRRFLDRRA